MLLFQEEASACQGSLDIPQIDQKLGIMRSLQGWSIPIAEQKDGCQNQERLCRSKQIIFSIVLILDAQSVRLKY